MAPTPARRPVGVVERRQAYVKSELTVYPFTADFYVILFRCPCRGGKTRAFTRELNHHPSDT